MSSGRPFQSLGSAEVNERSPTLKSYATGGRQLVGWKSTTVDGSVTERQQQSEHVSQISRRSAAKSSLYDNRQFELDWLGGT